MGDIILEAADFHSLGEFMQGQKSQNRYEEVAAFYKHRAKIESDPSFKPNPSVQEYGQPAQYYATIGRDCIDRATQPGVSAGFRESMYQQALKSYKDALKKYKSDHIAKIDTMTFSPDIFLAHIHDGIAEGHFSLGMVEEGKNSCDAALATWDKVKEAGKKDIDRDFEKTKLLGWKAICEAKLGHMEAAHDIFKSISNRWIDDESSTWLADIFLNGQEFAKATDVFIMLLSREAKKPSAVGDEDSGRDMAQKIIDIAARSLYKNNEKYTSLIRFYKKALELADKDIGKMILNKNIASSYLTLEPKDVKSAYAHLKTSWKLLSKGLGDEINLLVYKIGLLELLIPNRYLLLTENDFTCREIDIIEELLEYIEEASSFEDRIDPKKMPGFLRIKEQLIDRQQDIRQAEEAKIISAAQKVQLKKEALKAQKEKLEKEALKVLEVEEGGAQEKVAESAAAGTPSQPEVASLELTEAVHEEVAEPVSTSAVNESKSTSNSQRVAPSHAKALREVRRRKEKIEESKKRGEEMRARQEEERKVKEAADILAQQEVEERAAIEVVQRERDALKRQRAAEEAEKQKLIKAKELQSQKKPVQTIQVVNAKTDEEIRTEEAARAELEQQKAEQIKQQIAAAKALKQQVWNKGSKPTTEVSEIKEPEVTSPASAAVAVSEAASSPNHVAAAAADDNSSDNMSEASVATSLISARVSGTAGSSSPRLYPSDDVSRIVMAERRKAVANVVEAMKHKEAEAFVSGWLACHNTVVPKVHSDAMQAVAVQLDRAFHSGRFVGQSEAASVDSPTQYAMNQAYHAALQCQDIKLWLHSHQVTDDMVQGCSNFQCHMTAHLMGECELEG